MSAYAQVIQWNPEITVADGAVYGNLRPRATIVGSDTPVVIFGASNADENVFIARWNGTGFNTPVSIVPGNTSSYITGWTGPDIDSYGDTVVAIFKLSPLETGNVYSVRSIDGGITFSDTIRVDNHDVGVAWMPSMSMQPDGNPVATYMVHDGVWSNPRYVVVRSTDGGVSYTPEVEVTGSITGEACDCCPSEIVNNNQKEVLLFRNNEANIRDVYGILSTDAGSTYSSFANIDNLNWTLSSCPATGPDGAFFGDTLLTVHANASSGKYRVYVSSAGTNGSIVFGNRLMVQEPEQANGTQNYPRISASGDTIVMAWREAEGSDQDIYCSVSTAGIDPMGDLTGYKERANLTTTGIQTNPEIIYKNGIVHLFYQDASSGNLIYRRGTLNVNLGIDENDFTLNLYPNPSATGKFSFSGDIKVLHVTNVIGEPIEYKLYEKDELFTLELNHPSSGIYFLSYLTPQHQSKVLNLIVN